MKKHDRNKYITHDLDDILEEVLVDAYGEEEQLWAFYQAFKDNISLPADAFIIGEPVSVIQFDYSGNLIRGVTVKCQREDQSVYEASICDVYFIPGSESAGFQAAYRKWLNLEPYPEQIRADRHRKYSHKVRDNDIDPNLPVELIVLSTKQRSARCRLSGGTRTLTLRSADCHNMVPGEIVVIKPGKQWRYAGHPYLSGEFISSRLDISALGMKPLELQNLGIWDPEDHYWGEEDEPLENWEKQIIDRGPRPEFEMEQVLPGVNPDDPWEDPIIKSADLWEEGDFAEAEKILMELCEFDLRCLDAHFHLGHFVFDRHLNKAIRHFKVGVQIGESSLGPDFTGLLPWGFIDNRPFLRNLHSYGLCKWRLGDFDEAGHVFDRLLWLNPSDNQGIRFLINAVKEGRSWEEYKHF